MAYLLGSRSTTPEHLFSKPARLDTLLRAGLPVPPGVVLGSDEFDARHPDVEALLDTGPVIVRGIDADEDGPNHSRAGLSMSVVNCKTAADVTQAWTQIRASRPSYPSTPTTPPQALIQQFIGGTAVAVLATQAGGIYTELYPVDDSETLAGHQNPTFSGPLPWLPDASLQHRLDGLCQEVTRLCGLGQDLEVIVTPRKLWLVQVRPLTRPLGPADPVFQAAIARQQPPPDTRGLLVLDGEHNPAPLSPAHQSLIEWLQVHNALAQDLRVIAGWLYYARQPPTTEHEPAPSFPQLVARAQAAYTELQTVDLPAAREHYDHLTTGLASATRSEVAARLTQALAVFGQTYQRYQELSLGRLGRQLQSLLGEPLVAPDPTNNQTPSCLLTRAAYLDVLPLAWDVASPALAEWVPNAGLPTQVPVTPPPHQLATAVGELDDHLFALALAPTRQVYLRAARILEITPVTEMFYLPLADLARALAGQPGVAQAIARQKQLHQQLPRRAPRLLYHGHPLARPGQRPLEGMGLGPSMGGLLAVRPSLADTLKNPPAPGRILALPCLTAQAAVVLYTQGIRAVCCEYGGWMSHAAIMARELGLSAIIGCEGCTALDDGTPVWMDTTGGRLVVEAPVDMSE